MYYRGIIKKKVQHWIILLSMVMVLLYTALLGAESTQPNATVGTEGVWKTYRYVDGLACNYVLAIIQDKEGVIWFGTGNGVSRFDGKVWKTYTKKDGLASNYVNAIIQDKEGTIWFGTYGGGVSRYDGKSWKTYTQKDGLTDNNVISIMQDKEGAMWFGTAGSGISRYDGKSWKTYTQKDGLTDNNANAIMQDRKGAMWFGTGGWGKPGGVSRFDWKSWKTYTQQDGLPLNRVNALIQDKEGVIWVGTHGGGVSRYDGKSWKTYAQKDGLANNFVNAIIQDKEGAIWFGTDSDVSRFDGYSWKTYTQKDGLANNNVFAIMQDREGAIWFGTLDGVSRYDEKSWKTYTQKDGLASDRIYALMQDKEGAIWFGTGGSGVSRFDEKSWKRYIPKDELGGYWVKAFIQDKEGTIWVGTEDGGISRYDGKSWKIFTQQDGLASNDVRAIIQDKAGGIWVGTSDGVSRYDGKNWKTYTQKDGLAGNDVHAIVQDKEGAIWFGTYGGVIRYDGKIWKTYTQEDGLASNSVNTIMQDKEGMIWVGTFSDGVSRFDGKSWKTYTQEDGLTNNDVRAIAQDKEGVIWFGTSGGGGVSRFDGSCFQNIDSRDGLVNDAVYCLYMDRSGQIWIGTEGGVVRFNPPNKIPPPVYITQMIADETYDNPKGTIQLHSGIPRISLSYHAISFKTRPGAMKYFYQLVGKDNDWQGATNEETIEYFNLKPGEYTFMVQAVDRDLNYSEPASMEIKILSPPFYTGIWFIIGSIMTAFLIPSAIYGGLLIRQKKQTFEPIPNPYIVGNPIRSESMFFGREDDFRFIHDKLVGSPTGLIIVLAGERRSGKTSILYQILNGRLGERFVPIFVDMQAMTVRSDAEFFSQIAQETMNAIKQKYPSINVTTDEYNFHDKSHPAQTFQCYTDDLMKMLGDKTLLFLIDEYELLESKVEDRMISGDSITFFASLLERNPRIAILFTGSRHLEERSAPFWKVLLPKSIVRYITFLSEKDTYRLISEPVHGKVKYAKGVHESIYHLTAGQPFYTQIISQYLVDRLNIEQRNTAELNDVSVIVRELEENPPPQMQYFWDSFTRNQQLALSMLAELQEHEDQVISVTDMLRAVQEYNLPITLSEADWRGALEGLCRRDMIRRVSDKGEYQFRMDLFRPWIKHQHSIWSISEE